jgi:hypothetical protein
MYQLKVKTIKECQLSGGRFKIVATGHSKSKNYSIIGTFGLNQITI